MWLTDSLNPEGRTSPRSKRIMSYYTSFPEYPTTTMEGSLEDLYPPKRKALARSSNGTQIKGLKRLIISDDKEVSIWQRRPMVKVDSTFDL